LDFSQLPNGSDALNFLRYLVRRYREDGCSHRAAALTYMSLFALVPLMTVIYAVAAMVPAFSAVGDQIQDYMFTNLVPASGTQIQSYMMKFSDQAKNLTSVGISVLIVTAILMLRSIENAFNGIWRTERDRSGAAAFMLYWAVLSLAPLSVGLALGITTYLTSLPIFFSDAEFIGAGGSVLLLVLPTILGIAACTLVYITVPNCRVPFTHAFIGSVIVIILFQVAQALFTIVVVGSSYAFIYGAFAALPLFLLWLNLTWQIILFGGVLVHGLSAYQREQAGRHPLVIEALAVLHLFWEHQKNGLGIEEQTLLHKPIPSLDGVLRSGHWDTLRERFVEHQILRCGDNGKYFLVRNLHNFTLWQLQQKLEMKPEALPSPTEGQADWLKQTLTTMESAHQHQRDMLSPSLASLFEQSS
jgi:membrane protein